MKDKERKAPIGTIPYDIGLAKCQYAEMLKQQDIEKGKSIRPDKYYHDKAWKALNIDEELRKRNMSTTACPMPQRGGVKNMAKQKPEKVEHSVQDKIDYYSRRVNDPKLSEGQRKHAAKRISQLAGGGQAPARTSRVNPMPKPVTGLTASQVNAHMAGIGFGAAKEGGRVPVKDENKPNFRDGVKEGKALARRQKQSF